MELDEAVDHEVDPLEAVLAYHERTKHRPGRFARAPQELDWDHMPVPFRRFEGAPRVRLDLAEGSTGPSYAEAVRPGGVDPRPLDRAALSQLLLDALGLSGWKRYPGRPRSVPLRVNPSSGNLHPTEGYLISGPLEGLLDHAGVFHYDPFEHALELRLELAPEAWEALRPRGDGPAVLVGLTSIVWREVWKYGERGLRYTLLDLGHVVGTFAYAAAGLGWEASLLSEVPPDDLGTLLGVTGQRSSPEAEEPQCLLAIGPPGRRPGWTAPRELLEELGGASWRGQPNRLSEEHRPWPAVEHARVASLEGLLPPEEPRPEAPQARPGGDGFPAGDASLRGLIHQRRSCIHFDGRSGLTRDAFHWVLSQLLPHHGPFGVLPWRPRIDLGLFVHRVQHVTPGLYLLLRDPDPARRDALRRAMEPDFLWRDAGGGSGLPLVHLRSASCRDAAKKASCMQDIASDGAFAVAMFTDFRPVLESAGARAYRGLHWEAGLVGQALYLTAEALGMRGTGMGCYLDDLTTRSLFRVEGDAFQDLYHFAVGEGVEDPRVLSLPAYHHLEPEGTEAPAEPDRRD